MLLVLGVNAVAALVPFTPGGAGVQQALLVKVFGSGATVAAYSVGQQIAIAALTFGLGLAAVVWIFQFRSFKEVIRAGREQREAEKAAERDVKLAATEPFDGASLLAFLAARAVPGVEEVVGDTYRRSLPDGERRGRRPCTRTASRPTTRRRRGVRPRRARRRDRGRARARPAAAVHARARAFRAWSTATRLAIRAVLGQQISIQAAATHAARLVAAAGEPLAEPARHRHARLPDRRGDRRGARQRVRDAGPAPGDAALAGRARRSTS